MPTSASREFADRMAALYNNGNSVRDVAATVRRSYGFVHRALTEHPDVTMRSRSAGVRKGRPHRRR